MGLAADIGTLQRFPKIVGSGSKARELALTGREFNAAEAKEIGFVSEVVPGSRKEVLGKYPTMHNDSDTDDDQRLLSRWPTSLPRTAPSLLSAPST